MSGTGGSLTTLFGTYSNQCCILVSLTAPGVHSHVVGLHNDGCTSACMEAALASICEQAAPKAEVNNKHRGSAKMKPMLLLPGAYLKSYLLRGSGHMTEQHAGLLAFFGQVGRACSLTACA